MKVYNSNGNVITSVYGAGGGSLSQAYNTDGIGLLDDTALKVMCYNVQDFQGINAQQAMQNAIIAATTPTLIGIQEFYKTNTVPTIASNMLADYQYLVRNNHKNFLAIASKLQLTDVEYHDYETQDPNDISSYGETRLYLKAYFQYNNKNICILNTHLCLTESYKWAQMDELLSIAEQEEYCIVMGDFNSYALTTEESDYIHLFKPWVESGYNLANCSDDFGFTKTFSALTYANSVNDLQTAPDTIITSGNIDIVYVEYNTTKFNYPNGSKIDHIPIVATIEIN